MRKIVPKATLLLLLLLLSLHTTSAQEKTHYYYTSLYALSKEIPIESGEESYHTPTTEGVYLTAGYAVPHIKYFSVFKAHIGYGYIKDFAQHRFDTHFYAAGISHQLRLPFEYGMMAFFWENSLSIANFTAHIHNGFDQRKVKKYGKKIWISSIGMTTTFSQQIGVEVGIGYSSLHLDQLLNKEKNIETIHYQGENTPVVASITILF